MREWARDDDGDSRCEGHCNTCKRTGAGLRTYLRAGRGVPKQNLHLYVAIYEAMINTKQVTPTPSGGCAFATSQRTLATCEPRKFVYVWDAYCTLRSEWWTK
jgi:hypothetical protein